MAVFQLGKHVGAHFEQFIAAHAIVNASFICSMNRIPINVFVVKIAIVFIANFPQHFKVTFGIINNVAVVVNVARLQWEDK